MFECKKKIVFGDVCNLYMYYLFDFFVVQNFKKPKTSYIEKLKDVKWINKHIKQYNVVVFAIIIKINYTIVIVIIKNQ